MPVRTDAPENKRGEGMGYWRHLITLPFLLGTLSMTRRCSIRQSCDGDISGAGRPAKVGAIASVVDHVRRRKLYRRTPPVVHARAGVHVCRTYPPMGRPRVEEGRCRNTTSSTTTTGLFGELGSTFEAPAMTSANGSGGWATVALGKHSDPSSRSTGEGDTWTIDGGRRGSHLSLSRYRRPWVVSGNRGRVGSLEKPGSSPWRYVGASE